MTKISQNGVTFKWIVTVLLGLLLTLVSLGINNAISAIDRVDAKAEYLERTKLDTDQYRTDQIKIDKQFDNINKKLDRILDKVK